MAERPPVTPDVWNPAGCQCILALTKSDIFARGWGLAGLGPLPELQLSSLCCSGLSLCQRMSSRSPSPPSVHSKKRGEVLSPRRSDQRFSISTQWLALNVVTPSGKGTLESYAFPDWLLQDTSAERRLIEDPSASALLPLRMHAPIPPPPGTLDGKAVLKSPGPQSVSPLP